MLDVVEGVVDEKAQFGNDAHLVAHALAQHVANLGLVLLYILQQFLAPL